MSLGLALVNCPTRERLVNWYSTWVNGSIMELNSSNVIS